MTLITDELVERVARAVCAKRFDNRDVHEWDALPEDFKALYLDDARAALAVMVPVVLEVAVKDFERATRDLENNTRPRDTAFYEGQLESSSRICAAIRALATSATPPQSRSGS